MHLLKSTGKGKNCRCIPPIWKQQLKKLFDSGELGSAESKNPSQLYTEDNLVLPLPFFGRRGRKNQRQLTPTVLSLRKTPQGVDYFELNRSKPGSLPATKNYQGDLGDAEDESDAKIFSAFGSERCPVKTIKNYLANLNLDSNALFQWPRDSQFNPAEEMIWYCKAPLDSSTLDNII